MKVVLIGSGNVASFLGPALKKSGHNIIQLYSRTQKNGKPLASKLKCPLITNQKELTDKADIYIIALRDEAISKFLTSISIIPKLIVHTSGSIGIDIFPVKMNNCGVMYPLQTFSKTGNRFPIEIPFCIEGSDPGSTKKIKQLTRSLSSSVHLFTSSERAFIHLSAVFANNFSNYMFSLAWKILSKKKLPFEILRPLISETALKVQSGLPLKMQTGPAVRGDKIVIQKHIRLLKNFPEIKNIYKLMSKSIEKEYKH